jgi:DNA-binding NarL/FixJ family response regulator
MTAGLVLIAENDPVHRAFIRSAVLQSALGEVDLLEAADGREAVDLAREHRPEQIVLDLQMPLLSGIDAARRIWSDQPTARILFWSNYADEAYVRGLSRIVPPQAAYGYLLKSASPERFRAAIDGVFLQDQCIIDREVRTIQARAEDPLDALSDAEYDMLLDICLGLTDRVIAQRHGLSTRGVQSRLQRLYAKLGVMAGEASRSDGAEPFNARTRAICVALVRGLVNADVMSRANAQLHELASTPRAPRGG